MRMQREKKEKEGNNDEKGKIGGRKENREGGAKGRPRGTLQSQGGFLSLQYWLMRF